MTTEELQSKYSDAIKILMIRKGKTTLETDAFKIGDGFITGGNFFIPLTAISHVNVYRPTVNITPGIVAIVISIFLFCMRVEAISTIGGWVLAFGILYIIVQVLKALRTGFFLTIGLNDGYKFTISSDKREFLDNVGEAVRKCINEDFKGVYVVDMSDHSIHITNNNDDHSTNKTVFNGDVHTDRDLIINNQSDGLTDDDWKILTEFFDKKLEKISPSRADYNVYVKLDQCAKKKDEATLKQMFKKSGVKAVNALVSGLGGVAAKTITDILMKLL